MTTEKTIAVTGASGFIGRRICQVLSSAGYQVRAFVRSSQQATALGKTITDSVSGRLDDSVALRQLVNGVDAVIHCAGTVRGATQQQFDQVNVDGLQNLITVMKEKDQPPRLLVLSSLAAREPQLSFYAASKRKAEALLEDQGAGLQWLALRPPAVYGPGDKELLPLFRMMAKGIAPIPGDPSARFSMIFVDDLAAAVLAWCDQNPVVTGVHTLDDGTLGGYSWQDVCAIVSSLCGRRIYQLALPPALLLIPATINRELAKWFGYAPMLTPEKLRELRHPDWVCGEDSIRARLSWQPTVQLSDGLRKTPGWCKKIQ